MVRNSNRTRYQEIVGGDLALLTLADAPSEEPVPPEQADLIIHAALSTDSAYVMGPDDPTRRVACSTRSPMATGTAPLTETFFSPAFGMCVDRFGVPWMSIAASPDTQ